MGVVCRFVVGVVDITGEVVVTGRMGGIPFSFHVLPLNVITFGLFSLKITKDSSNLLVKLFFRCKVVNCDLSLHSGKFANKFQLPFSYEKQR